MLRCVVALSYVALWVAASVLLAPTDKAYGQWEIVAPNILSLQATGGAICYSNGILWAGTTNLVYSSDTGKSWEPVDYSGGEIYSIRFFDSLHGIIASSSGILMTVNGGYTWSNVPNNPTSQRMLDAGFGPTDSTLYVDLSNLGVAVSTDGGISWTMNDLDGLVMAMAISRMGTIYLAGGPFDPPGILMGQLYRSTDQGRTWRAGAGVFDEDSYSLTIDSCDPERLYLVSENTVWHGDDSSNIFVTTNAGQSWSLEFAHELSYLNGCITNSALAIFAGTLNDGILRSTDQGLTWQNIGGPGGVNDSRNLCAINDNLIFAIDAFGTIWETNNSGGDSISSDGYNPESFSLSANRLFESDTALCNDVTRGVAVLRSGCPLPYVTGWSIVGQDSEDYYLASISDDSISVGLRGGVLGAHQGKLILEIDDGSRDTVTLTGIGAPPPNTLQAVPRRLFSADTVECDSVTRLVTFAPGGCTPPSVTSWSIVGVDSESYSGSSISGDSIPVTLYGKRPGTQHAELILVLNDSTQDTVSLAGYVNAEPNALVASPDRLFTLDTVACDSVRRTINLIGRGCSPPHVLTDRIWGSDSMDFRVASLTNDSLVVTMMGGRFGNQNAALILALDNASSDTIQLAGYCAAPSNTLEAAPAELFATDTISCDSITQSVLLNKIGCNPPALAAWSIVGRDSEYYGCTNFAGDSMHVTLHGESEGSRQAKLVLKLDDGMRDTVVLGGYVRIAPTPVTLSTSDQSVAILGDMDSIPIAISGLVRPENVDLVLHYDGSLDYLGSFSPSGSALDIPGEEWPGRSLLHIAGAISNSIAGYAVFNVFSDSGENAHATFDSLAILTAASPCEYRSAPSVTSTIYPPKGCGIPILSQLIHLGREPVFRIVPNPSSGGAVLTSSEEIGPSTIELYDMLGTQRGAISTEIHVKTPVPLLFPAASGVYTIVIRSRAKSWVIRAVRE